MVGTSAVERPQDTPTAGDPSRARCVTGCSASPLDPACRPASTAFGDRRAGARWNLPHDGLSVTGRAAWPSARWIRAVKCVCLEERVARRRPRGVHPRSAARPPACPASRILDPTPCPRPLRAPPAAIFRRTTNDLTCTTTFIHRIMATTRAVPPDRPCQDDLSYARQRHHSRV